VRQSSQWWPGQTTYASCGPPRTCRPHYVLARFQSMSLAFANKDHLLRLLVNTDGNGAKSLVFGPIFARSAWAVTPSEKSSINTNRKSTTRIPMSPRQTVYIAPKPQRGLKNAEWPFSVKRCISLWRKSATKFHCANAASDKVVRHSLAYLSVQKWFAGDVPHYVKMWPKLAHFFQKRRFPINIR